jgi:hypothetical protein
VVSALAQHNATRSCYAPPRAVGWIIACVQQRDGVVTAIQLKNLGGKRITRGWLGGGDVQLAPPCDGELELAEGVESALYATEIFGVPCWATLGARRLDAIDLPSCVRRVPGRRLYDQEDHTSPEGNCPRWKAFMTQITNGDERPDPDPLSLNGYAIHPVALEVLTSTLGSVPVWHNEPHTVPSSAALIYGFD